MAKTLAHTCTIVVAALCTLFASSAYPHGGGLDRYGCHHNRKQGNYHCHKGPFAGKTFDSKKELRLQPHSGTKLGERPAQFRTVRRVVEGDTLVLENKERVRLIGIDTPETKHPNKPVEYYGKEASRFTKTMCEGKRVRLEFDQANAHIGHKDRYRRTLAYVFLEDGSFLNAEIIKQGYGFAYTRFPFKYMDEFRRYQREARDQRKGLWGRFADPPSTGKTTQPAASDLTKATRRPFFIIGLYRTRHPTFVYSQPREYSSKMFKLKKGTTVNVVSIHGDWLKIIYQHSKTPGFIKKYSLIP